MLKILLNGCCGRMGRVIANLAKNSEECEIICGVDNNPTVNYSFPVYESFAGITEKADVIIDFSNPAGLDDLLTFAIKTKTPAVICTTGYSPAETEKIKAAAELIPVFFSFNMSLGINLLVALSKKAAEVLYPDFDIEIVEKHHNQKLDAPSGTAIMLANGINQTLDNKMIYEYDRHAKRQKRRGNEIGIHSVRGGTIVGEHEVVFAGNQEVISLKHEAFSRDVFAVGAVKAAKFLADKTPGLYDMNGMI